MSDEALFDHPNTGVIVPDATVEVISDLVRVRSSHRGGGGRVGRDHHPARRTRHDHRPERRHETSARPRVRRRTISCSIASFIYAIYRAARSAVLQPVIERLWLRAGPWLNIMRGEATLWSGLDPPREEILDGLRTADGQTARRALRRRHRRRRPISCCAPRRAVRRSCSNDRARRRRGPGASPDDDGSSAAACFSPAAAQGAPCQLSRRQQDLWHLGARRPGPQSRCPPGRVHYPAGPFRLRQDHRADDARRVRDADLGRKSCVDGRRIDHVPPNQRGIGMVFQNYALFPHMTVAENLAFPLKVRGPGQGRHRPPSVQAVLDLVLPARSRRAAGRPAVRRPAAAHRGGAGADLRAELVLHGRAAGRARQAAARADAVRDQATCTRGWASPSSMSRTTRPRR